MPNAGAPITRGLILAIGLWAVIPGSLLAQTENDSSATNRGRLQVLARQYVMATVNEDSLYDPAAWVLGVGLAYKSRAFHHFQLAASGWMMQQIASYGVSSPDPKTGISNRYEIGLLDIRHPSRETLFRPEELSIRYSRKSWGITLGRQLIQSPFINPQDGRMRPTMAEGAWLQYDNPQKKWETRAGWFWRIAPRSTTGWYSTGKSIGIYPVGRDEEGRPSAYAGATSSGGIGLLQIRYETGKWNFNFWNTYAENLMNTAWIQVEKKWDISQGGMLLLGTQLLWQSASGNGGNADARLRYYPKGASALAFSNRLHYQAGKMETNINYTRITAQGKFLMPREWGKEPFYTFLPRERNEGFADVNAWMWSLQYNEQEYLWHFSIGVGQYDLPPVNQTTLNKYGMPGYRQLNLEWQKGFKGKWSGITVTALLVFKKSIDDLGDQVKSIENKVNLINANLALNYCW